MFVIMFDDVLFMVILASILLLGIWLSKSSTSKNKSNDKDKKE